MATKTRVAERIPVLQEQLETLEREAAAARAKLDQATAEKMVEGVQATIEQQRRALAEALEHAALERQEHIEALKGERNELQGELAEIVPKIQDLMARHKFPSRERLIERSDYRALRARQRNLNRRITKISLELDRLAALAA